MTTLFKAGDTVRLKDNLPIGKWELSERGIQEYLSEEMAKFAGKIVTISRVEESFYDVGIHRYRIDIDSGIHYWASPMFEDIVLGKAGVDEELTSDLKQWCKTMENQI